MHSEISEHPEKAYEQGISVRFWDFLFYVTFGIVITHSVGTAGVLLVFVFLVVPAVASMLITDVLWKQLVIGWSLGVFVSVIGLYISYRVDLPSGPTVVAFYGVMLIVIAIVMYLIRAESRKNAMMKIALGIGTTLVVIFGLYLMGQFFKSSEAHHHEEAALVGSIETPDRSKSLSDLSDSQLEEYLNSISDAKQFKKLFSDNDDDYIKLKIAEHTVNLDKKLGFNLFYKIISDDALPFVKEEAIEKMKVISNNDFGYDSSKSKEENKIALDKWKNWIDRI
ncbi:MAG: hypothetical protein GXO85_00605 [Chlorobi bacterium]|nr:hypothetical protein [Chlorobiota bacterium]